MTHQSKADSPCASKLLVATKPLLLLLLLLTGCTLHMDAPESYLKRAKAAWPYEYQAVSSDDCRLTARSIPNPEKGGIEFWSKSIRNQMVQAKGYALVSQQEVTNKKGQAGTEFLFSTHIRGVEFYYLLTFFPVGKTIYLAEAGGERPLIENDLEVLRKAISTLR